MSRRGVLAVADISGYTRYLAGVELEHSTDVLADLIGTIVSAMEGRFELAKLEGDAVFVHAPDGDTTGDAFVAAIEVAHLAFHDRLRNITSATTCTCSACARIVDLGLKFVVHHGEYATHSIAGLTELVGSDVITVHRLLKNHVGEATGLADYALFTRPFVERFGLEEAASTAMTLHSEITDGVGILDTYVLDLDTRLAAARDRTVVMVGPDEPGVVELAIEVDAPLAVAWDYGVAPERMALWAADSETHEKPDGLPGAGTRIHCVHGGVPIDHEILDWKPYRYHSYRSLTPAGPFLVTDTYEAIDDRRTRITMRSRPDGGPEQAALLDQHLDWLSNEVIRGRMKLVELLKDGAA